MEHKTEQWPTSEPTPGITKKVLPDGREEHIIEQEFYKLQKKPKKIEEDFEIPQQGNDYNRENAIKERGGIEGAKKEYVEAITRKVSHVRQDKIKKIRDQERRFKKQFQKAA
jgi:hypothetical protein